MAEKVALDVNSFNNHVSIQVKDLEASLRFYQGLLGLPLVRRSGEDPDIVWLPGLELSQLREGQEFSFTGHIGLGVRNATGRGSARHGQNAGRDGLGPAQWDCWDEPEHQTSSGLRPAAARGSVHGRRLRRKP